MLMPVRRRGSQASRLWFQLLGQHHLTALSSALPTATAGLSSAIANGCGSCEGTV